MDGGVYASASTLAAGGESTILFVGCTVDNNVASNQGGGLYVSYNKAAAATVDPAIGMVNGTVANNRAASSGGGLYLTRAAGCASDIPFGFFGVTVANNTASTGPGGGLFVSPIIPAGSAPLVGNSLFAFNTAGSAGPNVSGTVISLTVLSSSPGIGPGRNLVANASGSTGWDSDSAGDDDILGVSPFLGNLDNNGGRTLTIALLPGSPGIDASDGPAGSLLADVLFTDQRGVARPQGARFDIGAFERV